MEFLFGQAIGFLRSALFFVLGKKKPTILFERTDVTINNNLQIAAARPLVHPEAIKQLARRHKLKRRVKRLQIIGVMAYIHWAALVIPAVFSMLGKPSMLNLYGFEISPTRWLVVAVGVVAVWMYLWQQMIDMILEYVDERFSAYGRLSETRREEVTVGLYFFTALLFGIFGLSLFAPVGSLLLLLLPGAALPIVPLIYGLTETEEKG